MPAEDTVHPVHPVHSPDGSIDGAEDALQRGLADEASRLAQAVLQRDTAPAADKGRAINVLIQADFHFQNRLTDLNLLMSESGMRLQQLPVTAVLLWGVVAVELQAADEARSLLRRYLDTKHFGEGSGVSREDALALSRLYAVQLLSGLCGDFQAAADWLSAGGAGLSEEQQELLLLEVDEAEELAQEEHVAVWTSQDAAQAAHLSDHNPHLGPGEAAGAAEGAGAYSDPGQDCGEATDTTGSVVGSLASTAVAALHELGPSVSGALSNASLNPASHDEAAADQERDLVGASHEHAHAADAAAAPSAGSEAAAAGEQPQAACLGSPASPAAAPVVSVPVAAVAVRGLGDGERVPSSPSLASWRRSPDEVAVQDQGSSQGDSAPDNAYVTMTGAFNDQAYEQQGAAADSASEAARPGCFKQGASPDKAAKRLLNSSSTSGSGGGIKSRLRVAASDIAAAAMATVTAAVSGSTGGAAAATAKSATGGDAAADAEQQQQEEEGAEVQQQQQQGEWRALIGSYTTWASDKATETWHSQPVQDALKALNLQEVPPWELAGGAAAALLLTYSLYRNRRRVRRAAADFAAGVSQTAQMALGMSVNPMAAAPGTGHLMR